MNAESAFTETRGFRRTVGLAFLGLPTAAFASPLVAEVIGVFGGEPFRVRTKVTTVLISLIGMTVLLEWCRRRHRRLTLFMLFPVIAAFIWVVAGQIGLPESTFWPTPRSPQWPSATRPILLLVPAILSAAIAFWPRPFGMSLSAGIVLATTGYALLALARLAPGYLSPHYSIRDTSRQLGTLLADFSGTVATSGGDGLFRENTLRYTTVWRRTWPSHKPEVILMVFAFDDSQNLLVREYCQIGEYPLYIAPTYYQAHPKEWPTSALGQTARVYRRLSSSGCPDSVTSRFHDP